VIIAYGGVPAFIVTLGGFLGWRRVIFAYAPGQTLAPMAPVFALFGGGPVGSVGLLPSWIIGILACGAIVASAISDRRRRRHYGFLLPPTWALIAVIAVSCAAVLVAVWIANSYYWPEALAQQYAVAHNIEVPEGGL